MALKTTRQPPRSEIQLPVVLHALGDPIRLEIVRQIVSEGEREALEAVSSEKKWKGLMAGWADS